MRTVGVAVQRELQKQQVEIATPPCHRLTELAEELTAGRGQVLLAYQSYGLNPGAPKRPFGPTAVGQPVGNQSRTTGIR